MEITPNHRSEYYEGNEIGRYGRNLNADERSAVLVWYHDGLRGEEEPTWAMDEDLEFKISISVDVILVADATSHAVYSIDREAFRENSVVIDGRDQYIARASDPHVRKLGDPNDILNGHLWIESGNQVDEGYHKKRSEA